MRYITEKTIFGSKAEIKIEKNWRNRSSRPCWLIKAAEIDPNIFRASRSWWRKYGIYAISVEMHYFNSSKCFTFSFIDKEILFNLLDFLVVYLIILNINFVKNKLPNIYNVCPLIVCYHCTRLTNNSIYHKLIVYTNVILLQ